MAASSVSAKGPVRRRADRHVGRPPHFSPATVSLVGGFSRRWRGHWTYGPFGSNDALPYTTPELYVPECVVLAAVVVILCVRIDSSASLTAQPARARALSRLIAVYNTTRPQQRQILDPTAISFNPLPSGYLIGGEPNGMFRYTFSRKRRLWLCSLKTRL